MLSVTLDLRGERALVVGGGPMAARRVQTLLGAGVQIRVVSPAICEELRILEQAGQIELVSRPWSPGDDEGTVLVVAATGNPEVDRAVAQEARQAGRLLNVASEAELGNLRFAAEVRRGPVRIAISTSGAAPGISRRLRQELDRLIGPEWGVLAELYASVRERLLTVPGMTRQERNAVLNALTGGAARELLAAGRREEAEQLADELIRSATGT